MTIATPQVMQVHRIMQTRTMATMTPGDKTGVTPGVVVVLKLGCVVGEVGIAVGFGRSAEGRVRHVFSIHSCKQNTYSTWVTGKKTHS